MYIKSVKCMLIIACSIRSLRVSSQLTANQIFTILFLSFPKGKKLRIILIS
jgi:hypothetical protein